MDKLIHSGTIRKILLKIKKVQTLFAVWAYCILFGDKFDMLTIWTKFCKKIVTLKTGENKNVL